MNTLAEGVGHTVFSSLIAGTIAAAVALGLTYITGALMKLGQFAAAAAKRED